MATLIQYNNNRHTTVMYGSRRNVIFISTLPQNMEELLEKIEFCNSFGLFETASVFGLWVKWHFINVKYKIPLKLLTSSWVFNQMMP